MWNSFGRGRLRTVAAILGVALLLNVLFGWMTSGDAAETATSAKAPARASDLKDAVLTESANIAKETYKQRPLRILSIGAHPADVFDQSGGTMAHHVERGDWVGCAVLTTGVRVHDKVIANEMHDLKVIPPADELKKTMALRATVKEKEVVQACALLGVHEQDVHFLGTDDAILLVNQDSISQVARLIRKLRPDVILTHFPFESAGIGSAHATTGQIVLYALSAAGGVEPGDPTPPHKVTQVFFFGQGSSGPRTDLWGSHGGYTNDVFIDITDVAHKKVACLDAMESQGYGGPYARKRIETTDGAFGSKIGLSYAEGFISLHSTRHYYLPVSELDLRYSNSADHKRINRKSYRIDVD